MRSLIAGNWKMNGTGNCLAEIALVAGWVRENGSQADLLICPPFTLISRATGIAAGAVALGGQDCHAQMSGAFTGDVSAEMLRDAGAAAVIVGHSERRRYHGETDAMVAAKAEAAWHAGLLAIVCIGETEEEHDTGRTDQVVAAQLEQSLPAGALCSTAAIAYEPIWAIGSGRTPTLNEIAGVHRLIRAGLDGHFGEEGARMRILYGGSVKPENARPILTLPNVNGALVGGASLKAHEFLGIVRAAPP
jgi:triosephosphate isomerase